MKWIVIPASLLLAGAGYAAQPATTPSAEAGEIADLRQIVVDLRTQIAELKAVNSPTPATSAASGIAGWYSYQWGRDERTIELLDDGHIRTGEINYPGFGRNERRWTKAATGIRFDGEDGGVQLFLCADGNYRGTGGDSVSVVLSHQR